jgi:hypothetical protein
VDAKAASVAATGSADITQAALHRSLDEFLDEVHTNRFSPSADSRRAQLKLANQFAGEMLSELIHIRVKIVEQMARSGLLVSLKDAIEKEGDDNSWPFEKAREEIKNTRKIMEDMLQQRVVDGIVFVESSSKDRKDSTFLAAFLSAINDTGTIKSATDVVLKRMVKDGYEPEQADYTLNTNCAMSVKGRLYRNRTTGDIRGFGLRMGSIPAAIWNLMREENSNSSYIIERTRLPRDTVESTAKLIERSALMIGGADKRINDAIDGTIAELQRNFRRKITVAAQRRDLLTFIVGTGGAAAASQAHAEEHTDTPLAGPGITTAA